MAPSSSASLLLPLALLLAGGCAGPSSEAAPPAAPGASGPPPSPSEVLEVTSRVPLDQALFERVALVGASMSAGFNLQLETGLETRLSDFLDEALLVEHGPFSDAATELLFLDTLPMGEAMVDEALASEPSLVLALDFPFWFLYGPARSTAHRLERLEVGLAQLDRFDCPVVVGDIPFMARAAGGMIPHSAMPAPEAFGPANARIAAWVAADERRALLPVADFHAVLEAGGGIDVGGVTWDPAVDGELLQADALHPNLAGTAALLVQALVALADAHGASLTGVALQDPAELADAVDDRMVERAERQD